MLLSVGNNSGENPRPIPEEEHMDTLKARKAVEDLATYFVALNEAKEGCKDQVAARLELLVSEDATPITREDIRNLKRAGKAVAKQAAEAERLDAEQYAELMNAIGL